MKFSQSWLSTFFANNQLPDEFLDDKLADKLTMNGLEVEELYPAVPEFSNVVVAKIVSAQKHPDADKLRVCTVDIGDGNPLQIVCGAPNARENIYVPCAKIGAVLNIKNAETGEFSELKIKKGKLRGVESFGMLCSAKELNLSSDHSGLMELDADFGEKNLGKNLREILQLNDLIFDIKLTPNRADCLSLLGIAREVGALAELPLNLEFLQKSKSLEKSDFTADKKVILESPQSCPRYIGRIFKNVDAKAKSPDWLVERLNRSGIRSISALVDITNYVMLELGQPLHAFDNQKINGNIHVKISTRNQENFSKLKLLNEQVLQFDDEDQILLICDEQKPLAMAGIMGGDESGITLETTEVFLESAFFTPTAIAGKARKFGFGSDASYRYERGVDFDGCQRAMLRASELILEICGGQCSDIIVAENAEFLPKRHPVILRTQRCNDVLGLNKNLSLSADSIENYLKHLHFAFKKINAEDFEITPPSWRFDLEIEEDFIEEIARLYGYNNIPAEPPLAKLAMLSQNESSRNHNFYKKLLVSRGFFEVINYSFVDEAWEQDFTENHNPIRLANPIASQMSVMRSSLLGGLLSNLKNNLNRQQNRVRIFEHGRIFYKNGKDFVQQWNFGGLIYGTALANHWQISTQRQFDFYDLKGDVEFLLSEFKNLKFTALQNHKTLHPGRAANIELNGETIGFIGELHPLLCQKYGLNHAPIIFEINAEKLSAVAIPKYQELSAFPSVLRDLALVVEKNTQFAEILETINKLKAKLKLIQNAEIFDVYTGKGVAENQKSLAVRITLQDQNATLTDEIVENAMQKIIKALQENNNATLRA